MKRSSSATAKSKASAPTPRTKQTKTSVPNPPKKSITAARKKPAALSPAKASHLFKVTPNHKGLKVGPVAGAGASSKKHQLITLLGSATGATMAQMTALTGWLPHTLRAMISVSLRKGLGLDVQQQLEDGVRVYRILGVRSQ